MQRRTKDTGRGELLGSEFCCLISLRVRCTRTPEEGLRLLRTAFRGLPPE